MKLYSTIRYFHKKKSLYLIVIFIMCPVFAWNYVGHILSAQIAYDQFSINQQKNLNRRSQNIYDHSSLYVQHTLDRYTNQGASLWAAEMILPDIWKRNYAMNTLHKTFVSFNLPVPHAIQSLQYLPTRKMHYVDYVINHASTSYIHNIRNQNNNIIIALHALQQAYKDAIIQNHLKTAFVLSIYLIHLQEDLTQPLHTFEKNIASAGRPAIFDLGGNKYCLSTHITHSKRCRNNLHTKWDQGFNQLSFKNVKHNGGFHQLSQQYIKKFHSTLKPIPSINDTIQTNQSLATFVYSTPQHQSPNQLYIQKAQNIVRHHIWQSSQTIRHLYP